jgi:hypothetical protein
MRPWAHQLFKWFAEVSETSMRYKPPIKVILKRTGADYTVTSIVNAITLDLFYDGEAFDVRVGNNLSEAQAQKIAESYAVTVR